MRIANIAVLIVGIIQTAIAVAEMILWIPCKLYEKAHVASLSPDELKAATPIIQNAGLYNGFIAAGLIWSLMASSTGQARQLKLFFLTCVFAAGIFGGITLSSNCYLFQSLPALIAGILVWRSPANPAQPTQTPT